ncbi:hypothetical protein DM860_004021 [Cuscuta australis]|uniref:Uncharacterized protein n=1 Tax=Cuscuta australis TaxID=267555 RepID=A0A328CYH9_9ASTE|nr:hypothetical protein DM860_004021 [Cuscuta australis]
MSASSKYDLTSSSPDRPLYGSAHRGSYGVMSLDKTGNMDNPMSSSLANMGRSSSGATQGDVVKFFQCLRIDPKAMVTEHKLRQIDYKRLTSLSLGVPLDDSPSVSSKGKTLSSSSPEDGRRLKLSLRDGCIKARERVKIFYESSSVFSKCFPNVPTRKRSRSDVLSNDRNIASFSTERPLSGTSISKIGTQNHSIIGGFEVEQQKSDERAKTVIPSKRTRTSMSEVRPNTPARPSGNLDRDRDLRLPNNNSIHGEDRTSTPIAIEGWEKLRMKKKRSGIKPDMSGGSAAAKPVDGYRESKQGMQSRLSTDVRSRLNDNHNFRNGTTTGSVGLGKTDATSPQASLAMRSSFSKAELDNGSLHDRRDRPIGSEKERTNVRAVNNATKTTAREDLSSGSPTSSAKLNGALRAPRSGVGVGPKLGPMVQHAGVANDWEVSHCTNKLPLTSAAGNRKRTSTARSSSPPVGQWAGQRPQKSSRTARRTNFPSVPNNAETPVSENSAEAVGNERRLSGSSPQQFKLRSDNFSAASGSEESGVAETKSKDKSKRSDEVDGKIGVNTQKMSTLLLPPRKNKLVGGDEHSDGVRRQGRSNRSFTSSGSLTPLTVEKLGNVGTAKQLRSSRHSFDKSESKAGRPPTRKLSDRRAYQRQKHSTINAAADFLVGSYDGQDELLAAASDVTNTAQALSSPFWKRMESLFRFISDLDITFLNQQVNSRKFVATPAPIVTAASKLVMLPNGVDRDGDEARSVEFSLEHGVSGTTKAAPISLYQRLMAALIPEEASEELSCSGTEDPKFNVYQPISDLDMDSELDILHRRTTYNTDSRHLASNGYRKYANGKSFDERDHSTPDCSIRPVREREFLSDCNHTQNGLLLDEVMMSDVFCTEYQYNKMSINERLLLEVQYIGIYPEPDSGMAQDGDEEISGDIRKLDQKYQELVLEKNDMLHKLLDSADKTRACQEKDFEQLAFDKLVEMAYKKYMACCGRNVHGMKSGKMAKQAALAFVKRTLERYEEFEETGKSCFNESLFKEMFFSGISQFCDGQIDLITDGEPGSSGDARPSGSMGKQQSPSPNHEVFTEGNLAIDANRVKRRELFLDDVGNKIGTSGMLLSTAKGKRSERDRDGKGNNREVLYRNGSNKIGRPASANVRGERKPKAKPKQKTTQLSTSLNNLVGNTPEQSKPTGPSITKPIELSTISTAKDNKDCESEELEEPIDLSSLQLPGMDVLGVPDDLGGQGQDIGSWLNFDDEGLQDHDFVGLEIPMDDLADLNMMV